MEHDEIQMFLDAERERRKTPREREIEIELQQIAEKHRKAMVEESEPLFRELSRIEVTKAPMPIVVDGKIYKYVGPQS